ncbi:helix-turn-helix transcriptional regulator [Granulicatella sp. zg-ZJ]|uniref:helix-turn-helix domain-containing protein n=1 Tax=Granulicatella sp. zg-ZJ TaxID=2678504 RepID=UPI001F07DB0C|nr:helix-turn-helix transcriptional regulator [Granulicatella sp. zg-ZJ]
MNEAELKRIIEYRYNSLRAFAIENDIPYTTIRSILERGVMNAKAETVFKICSILGIKPEVFDTSLQDTQKNTLSTTIQSIVDTSIQLEEKRQENVLCYAEEQLKEQLNAMIL